MALGDYMGAQCHACIGGTSVREDMRKLWTWASTLSSARRAVCST
jgi:hypothetical protein